VPWIHNVKNTDVVLAIDDNAVVGLARLFNAQAGRACLAGAGVPRELVGRLDLLGFSGISNLLSSIKYAKYFELGRRDVVLTVLTDSMQLYGSRLAEMQAQHGEYRAQNAAADFARWLAGASTDHLLELSYQDRRRVHNLKYYTWVEQQGRGYEEIMAQWYDPDYWTGVQSQSGELDALIERFNRQVAG